MQDEDHDFAEQAWIGLHRRINRAERHAYSHDAFWDEIEDIHERIAVIEAGVILLSASALAFGIISWLKLEGFAAVVVGFTVVAAFIAWSVMHSVRDQNRRYDRRREMARKIAVED